MNIKKIDLKIENPYSVYFTSDPHYNHKNVNNFCHRPFESLEEMNEGLINNWNNKISNDDIVFILGDFAFSTNWEQFTSRLKGHKYLILGNHDLKGWKNSFESLFEGVAKDMTILVGGKQKVLMTHYPLLTWPGRFNEDYPTWNLHGHIHSGPKDVVRSGINDKDPYREIEFRELNKYYKNRDPFQYDVGVDNNDYSPVSFLELTKILPNS